jgi:hypothetical protein
MLFPALYHQFALITLDVFYLGLFALFFCVNYYNYITMSDIMKLRMEILVDKGHQKWLRRVQQTLRK